MEGPLATEPISEDECIFCGHWPENDRWVLRDAIAILPLEEDGVCDACFRDVLAKVRRG